MRCFIVDTDASFLYVLAMKTANRQTQSRESNWLWHDNRIIIIHPQIFYQNRFMNMSNICPSNKWVALSEVENIPYAFILPLEAHTSFGWIVKMPRQCFREESIYLCYEEKPLLHKSYFQELSIALIECNSDKLYHLHLIPNRLCY